MLDYSVSMLGNIADWLMTPPMSYITGFLMLSFALSIILTIIRPR